MRTLGRFLLTLAIVVVAIFAGAARLGLLHE